MFTIIQGILILLLVYPYIQDKFNPDRYQVMPGRKNIYKSKEHYEKEIQGIRKKIQLIYLKKAGYLVGIMVCLGIIIVCLLGVI